MNQNEAQPAEDEHFLSNTQHTIVVGIIGIALVQSRLTRSSASLGERSTC